MRHSSTNLALHRVNKFRGMIHENARVPDVSLTQGARAYGARRLDTFAPEVLGYGLSGVGAPNEVEGSTATKDIWGFLTSTITKAGEIMSSREERKLTEARTQMDSLRDSITSYGRGLTGSSSNLLLLAGGGLLVTMLVIRSRGR